MSDEIQESPFGPHHLTKDDAGIAKVFQQIIDIITVCEQSDEFAGFLVHDIRDKNGYPVSIKLDVCIRQAGIRTVKKG